MLSVNSTKKLPSRETFWPLLTDKLNKPEPVKVTDEEKRAMSERAMELAALIFPNK